MDAGREPRVLLYGKPGCHLCDVAREVVARVCADVGETFEERNILDDPQLEGRYGEQIPVIVVDGREHGVWLVEEDRLRHALTS